MHFHTPEIKKGARQRALRTVTGPTTGVLEKDSGCSEEAPTSDAHQHGTQLQVPRVDSVEELAESAAWSDPGAGNAAFRELRGQPGIDMLTAWRLNSRPS